MVMLSDESERADDRDIVASENLDASKKIEPVNKDIV